MKGQTFLLIFASLNSPNRNKISKQMSKVIKAEKQLIA